MSSSGDQRGRIVRNSYALMGASVASMGISISVVAFAARAYGPEGLGQINYAFAFVSMFTVLGTLSMDTVVVKRLLAGDSPAYEGRELGTALVLRLGGGLAVVVLAGCLGFVMHRDEPITMVLIFVMSTALALRALDVVEYWVHVHLRSTLFSSIRIAAIALVAGLKVISAANDAPIVVYACLYILDVLVVGFAWLVTYRCVHAAGVKWSFDRTVASSVLRETLPLIGAGIISSIAHRLDQVMLGVMLPGKAAVGLYAAATTLSEVWYFVPVAIVNSLKGTVMRTEGGGGRASSLRVMRLLSMAVTWTSVFMALLFSLSAPFLIGVVYGESFADAGGVLVALSWVGILNMLGVARSVWLVREGLQRYALVYTSLALATTVVLNLLLIPALGLYGAVISRAVSQLSSFLSLLAFSATRESVTIVLNSLRPSQGLRALRLVVGVATASLRGSKRES